MEKIPYDVILDIQKKVNIVDVIAEYLPIEQKGKNYFAICPFHDDHNPSMSISPEKQIYTCFVCGASGNVFNFVMNYEKISFTSAVSKIAQKIGINLNYDTKQINKNIDNKYDKYYKMYEITNKYYQNNLKTIYGKTAINYLHNRNFNDDIIKEFEIGLSLGDNNVNKLLLAKGYNNNELVDIGLCGSKNDFIYDTFRNRIMFPLYNTDGKVIGFSGRIYNNEDENKYVNSMESIIFKKGNNLYNYHRAFNHARELKQIIIVEGFMDVIRLYSVGIKNVVATMGTAITKEHVNLIRRLSKNIILCFDGDKAGKKATISALSMLEDSGLDPKIIRLEEDLDPDDYIVKKGERAFLNHLNNPISKLEFKLNIDRESTNFNNFNDISKYVNSAIKELEKVKDDVVYELTIKKISKETGVDPNTIKSMINKNNEPKVRIIDKPKIYNKNKYVKSEEYLIYYMLKNVDAILIYQNKVSYLSNKKLSIIANLILDFYEQNHYIDVTKFTIYLEDKSDLINEVLRIDALNLPDMVSIDQINDYVKTIDEGIIKKEIRKIKEKINIETNINKKVELLEKLALLKKKECK